MKSNSLFASYSLILLSLIALSACSNDQGGPVSPTGDPRTDALMDSLFAPPTQAEKQVALSYLREPIGPVQDLVIEHEDTLRLADQTLLQVRIVSHTSDSLKHYGAILYPASGANALPMLLHCHWGDAGVAIDQDWKFLMQMLPGVGEAFVHVIPSFRSEPLVFGAQTWVSDGPGSPWKGDVSDALGLVAAAESLAVTDSAIHLDATRLRVIGFSRGGGVALLAALRDARVERVVDYFGPTDLFDTYAKDIFTSIVRGDTLDLPGLSDLDSMFIQPLLSGELSMSQVRHELLIRSPAHFAEELPLLMVHHGSADSVVSVTQSQILWDRYTEAQGSPQGSVYFEYPGVGHNPVGMLSQVAQTTLFLLDASDPSALQRSLTASPMNLQNYNWVMPGFQ